MKNDREFYEKQYHFDEDVAVLDNNRIANFFRHLKVKKTDFYLDIGCGVGTSLVFCRNLGCRCLGFDISERAIYLARKNISSEIQVMVADGENLPFRNNVFDIVSSLGSIEHFPSVEKGLQQLSNVIKPGGLALFVVPNSFWLLNKIHVYKGTEQPQEMLATIGEWGRLFTKHGFSTIKVHKDIGPKILKNFNFLAIIKRLLLRITIALPVPCAYQFIFVCKKVS